MGTILCGATSDWYMEKASAGGEKKPEYRLTTSSNHCICPYRALYLRVDSKVPPPLDLAARWHSAGRIWIYDCLITLNHLFSRLFSSLRSLCHLRK